MIVDNSNTEVQRAKQEHDATKAELEAEYANQNLG